MVRVIVDRDLRTPLTSRLAETIPESPLWLVASDAADTARRDAFDALGVHVIQTAPASTGIDLVAGIHALGDAGLTRILVEGGARIAASCIRANLVDRIAWFHAPAVMGDDGWPGVRGFGIEKLAMMPRFVRHRVTPLGADVLTEFKRQS